MNMHPKHYYYMYLTDIVDTKHQSLSMFLVHMVDTLLHLM